MPACAMRHPRAGVWGGWRPRRQRCHDHRQAGAGLSPSRGRREDEHGGIMTDRTYRGTEIVGTSTEGLDPAIRNALHRAAQTLRHLDWFEVTQIRGQIED